MIRAAFSQVSVAVPVLARGTDTTMEDQPATSVDEFYERNAKGDILVSDEELRAAFEFFDKDGKGKITLGDLRSRLGAFYTNMPMKEYKFLMNNQSEMTFDDLKSLLQDNEITNFDPLAEAFKAYDPAGTGYVDQGVLRRVLENLGFGEITEDDMKILIETGDVDKDGKISLADFREMVKLNSADKDPDAGAAAAAAGAAK